MVESTGERAQNGYARLAGFLFLFVTAVHLAGIAITARMNVPGNFAATAQHIKASEHLYRIGLSLELLASFAAVLLAWALYVLLKPVDASLALFALLWRMASAVLGTVAVLFSFAAVKIYSSAAVGFEVAEPESLVALATRSATTGIHISAIFFSVSSLIYFYLLFRSRLIPRILSILGVVSSILFPLVSFGILIAPEQATTLQYGWAPMLAAETLSGLWLLVLGPKSGIGAWHLRST